MLQEHKQQLAAAVGFHKAGRIDAAQQSYLFLRRLYPKNFDVVHLLGLTFLQMRQFAKSIETLEEAIALNPNSAMAYSNLGNAYKARGEIGLALGSYDKALLINPNSPEARYNRGNARQALDDLAGALSDYDDVVRQQPNHYLALIAKSNIHRQMHQPGLALQAIDAAIAANPRFVEALNNKGNILLELGRYDEASASFDRAIKLNPNHPDAHYNTGNLMLRLQEFGKALAGYNKAISLKPDHADAYSNRGVVLQELHLFDEALASHDKAISLKPDYAEAYSNRGNTLKELGRFNEASASYDKAISLKPDHALAWLGLAQIDSETGRFEEAEIKFQKARALNSKLVAPLCGIADVKKYDSSDPIIQDIEDLLAGSTLSSEDRARLHHAYAKICNDLGRYEDAFDNFALGKGLMKSRFSIEKHGDAYAAMRRLFTPEFFAERMGFGLPDERPVFIVGMPRSGTTLTEQILASHRLIDGLGELRDLPDVVRQWCGKLDDPSKFAESVLGLKSRDVTAMAERYLAAFGRAGKGSVRVIDKRPHNYEWLGLIALMFPKAHIIHCRRDPLDNCISMYMQKFNKNHGYNQDLSVLGLYYREYLGLMDHWSSVLPVPIHDIDYEHTVRDLEASSRSLVSFLGLEWDPGCLDYHQNDRTVSTPSRWQVRQPLYDKSVGRWRRYENQVGPLRKSLGIQS